MKKKKESIVSLSCNFTVCKEFVDKKKKMKYLPCHGPGDTLAKPIPLLCQLYSC